ncbi:MAG TPA: hypothetical protein VKA53_01840, partial [Thermoanaerobaculia bacterium]|nr:hypothetical protein [Thermoanaerobaculia bacterium]
PTFGSGGLVVTSMPAYLAPIRALAQQPNGELVAAGTLENGAYGSGMVVARYQHDGTFDQHFGQQNGLASAGPISSNAAGVAIERDGKIIVVGSAEGKLAAAILITRFNVDGTPDEGFGAGGWVLTEIPGTYYSNANAVAIQSDGKLVVTGLQETQAGDDLLLARYDLGALGCTPDSTHLCLDGNRFQVSVNWTNYNTGVSALATAVPFRDESGFFYFQDSANIEVMVKMHNACKGYGHYWFFSAATTDVAYTITVTDTETGLSETYSNPAHVLSEAKTDQSSFSCP